MKSLRLKNTHYFRTGMVVAPSINGAKRLSRQIGGSGKVSVIHDKPTAYSVFSLDDIKVPASEEFFKPYHAEFQAQLDQLQEIQDKMDAVQS